MKLLLKNIIMAAVICVSVVACSATGPISPDTTDIPGDEGLVAFRVVGMDGTVKLRKSQEGLDLGRFYSLSEIEPVLLGAKSGEMVIAALPTKYIYTWFGYVPDDESSIIYRTYAKLKFKVAHNSITYIGDIHISKKKTIYDDNGFVINVVDNSEEVRKMIAMKYAAVYGKYGFRKNLLSTIVK